ncbi:MAG TPA: hypothetical protein VF884_12670 [Nitrososphaeraceae archaeon]
METADNIWLREEDKSSPTAFCQAKHSKSSSNIQSWSEDYHVSRFKQQLGMTISSSSKRITDLLDNGKNFDSKYYYNQAYHYLKIGALKPVPHFLVSISDLSEVLIQEFLGLDKDDQKFVLKQSVSRISEDINPKLYHDSISKVLEVRLLP